MVGSHVEVTLRLDLEAYRELEAFTQFGSDLDQQTKSKLERGKRTVELLKQGLHENVIPEKLVFSIYALTHGYFDKVEVTNVLTKEQELYNYLDMNNDAKALLDEIKTTKQLPDNESIKNVLNNFFR